LVWVLGFGLVPTPSHSPSPTPTPMQKFLIFIKYFLNNSLIKDKYKMKKIRIHMMPESLEIIPIVDM